MGENWVLYNGEVVKFNPDIDPELVMEEWMIYSRLLGTQKGIVRDMQAGIEEVLGRARV